MFNKSDYTILSFLNEKECFNPLASVTIKQIIKNTNLSDSKVRNVLKSFILIEYVKEGAKDGVSKTYFITKKGVDFLFETMNIEVSNNGNEIEEE